MVRVLNTLISEQNSQENISPLLTCICLTAGVNLLTPSGHRQIRDVIITGIDMCGRRMRKGGGGGWTIYPSRR